MEKFVSLIKFRSLVNPKIILYICFPNLVDTHETQDHIFNDKNELKITSAFDWFSIVWLAVSSWVVEPSKSSQDTVCSFREEELSWFDSSLFALSDW